ncbi:sulfatase [Verrucomicrobiaceae bacterium R5-34]|nr:sulfatase [Verrucomicrobiaceae bacterium R5-34]
MHLPRLLIISLIPLSILQAREATDRPNVVIIYLDDSGHGDYAHNGNPVIETPNISKLASQGTSFTQFYVTSPACSASRYSLLTGRYPAYSQLGSWVIGPGTKSHLREEETTIAEGLKAVGYATGMFGKWHLGSPNKSNQMSPASLPLAHGFDRWVGTNVSHDYANSKLLASDPKGEDPIPGYREVARNLPSDVEASESLTGRYTAAAVDFIKAHKEQPFFAYIAHNQPHLGLFASDEFKGKSRRGLLGDVMAEVDHSVGQIMDTLKAEGIEKNTLIFFASDNGPWVKFRDAVQHKKYGEARMHVGYAMPFRDGKGSCWEGGHRVPGIFYWPGVIPAQRQLNPASTLDVLPTIFALTGSKHPHTKKLDGRDIRPLLASKKFPGQLAEFEFYYSHSRNQPIAIRLGPWKLMTAIPSQTGNKYGFQASDEKPLLFNVEQDISERINRAAKHPQRVQEMLEKLKKQRGGH